MTAVDGGLARRLGTGDAVVIGLGSMIGAGIFAAFAPAAAAAIGFSSFGVLLYYTVANAAAYTQDADHRRWPRRQQVAGILGCLLLVATLPPASIVTGLAVLGVGVLVRLVLLRRPGRSGTPT